MPNARYAVYAVGRTFSEKSDLSLFFKWCAGALSQTLLAAFPRMRALVEILQYREHAPWSLAGDDPYVFAEATRDVMQQEVLSRNIRAKFFKAAGLLVALLRVRLADRYNAFLDPRDETHRSLVSSVQSILREAQGLLPTGPRRDALAELLTQIQLYLERRGTDALLFDKLEAQAEGEGDEDA